MIRSIFRDRDRDRERHKKLGNHECNAYLQNFSSYRDLLLWDLLKNPIHFEIDPACSC